MCNSSRADVFVSTRLPMAFPRTFFFPQLELGVVKFSLSELPKFTSPLLSLFIRLVENQMVAMMLIWTGNDRSLLLLFAMALQHNYHTNMGQHQSTNAALAAAPSRASGDDPNGGNEDQSGREDGGVDRDDSPIGQDAGDDDEEEEDDGGNSNSAEENDADGPVDTTPFYPNNRRRIQHALGQYPIMNEVFNLLQPVEAMRLAMGADLRENNGAPDALALDRRIF